MAECRLRRSVPPHGGMWLGFCRMVRGGKVVVCGSMKVFDAMVRVGAMLERAGLDAVVPDQDGCASPAPVEKRVASRRHMRRIQEVDTSAVLIVNVDRSGADNYVGANAFAEAAVAFSHDRRIYLLHGMPRNFADELAAWGAVCLDGDVSQLLHDLGSPRHMNDGTSVH